MAALKTVPARVLQAAVVLLEKVARSSEDDKVRTAAAGTVDLLRKAMASATEA